MSPKEEDFIRFYRDAVIAGHDAPAAETMRHFNLSRDYSVRLLNETIVGCEGQDIRNWKSGDATAEHLRLIEGRGACASPKRNTVFTVGRLRVYASWSSDGSIPH